MLAALALLCLRLGSPAPAPVAAPAHSPPRQEREAAPDSPPALLRAAVKVLDGGDHLAQTNFLLAWCVKGAPIEATVGSLQALGQMYGPYALEREADPKDGELLGYGRDRFGARVVFRLAFQPGPPLRLLSFTVAPAYMTEGADPRLVAYRDLKSLALTIATAHAVPGMAIATEIGGKIDVGTSGVRALGAASPIKPSDPFAIGSIGKSMCATAIARLIDQGKLRWDETLREALPGVPMSAGFAAATLEQAMRHRAGFPADTAFTGDRLDKIIGGETDPQKARDRYVRELLAAAPESPPGDRFLYSNAGYAVLARVAELAAGEPYEQALRKLVFEPLGMTESFAPGEAPPADRPVGNRAGPEGLSPGDADPRLGMILAGAGLGVWCSVGDLVRFGEAHLAALRGEGAFLRPETAKRLHAMLPEYDDGPGYACGWTSAAIPGIQPFEEHEGTDETMRAVLAIFPAANLVVAAAVNSGGAEPPGPAMDAVLAIGARLAGAPR